MPRDSGGADASLSDTVAVPDRETNGGRANLSRIRVTHRAWGACADPERPTERWSRRNQRDLSLPRRPGECSRCRRFCRHRRTPGSARVCTLRGSVCRRRHRRRPGNWRAAPRRIGRDRRETRQCRRTSPLPGLRSIDTGRDDRARLRPPFGGNRCRRCVPSHPHTGRASFVQAVGTASQATGCVGGLAATAPGLVVALEPLGTDSLGRRSETAARFSFAHFNDRRTLAVVLLADSGRQASAVVSVGFSVAAAHGRILVGTDLGSGLANAGDPRATAAEGWIVTESCRPARDIRGAPARFTDRPAATAAAAPQLFDDFSNFFRVAAARQQTQRHHRQRNRTKVSPVQHDKDLQRVIRPLHSQQAPCPIAAGRRPVRWACLNSRSTSAHAKRCEGALQEPEGTGVP